MLPELAERAVDVIAAVGGSAAVLELFRRWLQRRQEKRQDQVQREAGILEESKALRQEAFQREREALQALAEERERRHKADLLALEAKMQAEIESLTRTNTDLSRRLEDATTQPEQRLPGPGASRRQVRRGGAPRAEGTLRS